MVPWLARGEADRAHRGEGGAGGRGEELAVQREPPWPAMGLGRPARRLGKGARGGAGPLAP